MREFEGAQALLEARGEMEQVSKRWRPRRSLAVNHLLASEYDEWSDQWR